MQNQDFAEEHDEDLLEDQDFEMDQQPFEDDSIQGFFGHKNSVYCLDVAGDLAISGDGDDRAFLWSISDGETLWALPEGICSDSIVAAKFSHDAKLAAFASLDGKIVIVSPEANPPSICLGILDDGPSEISALCWHLKGNVLVAAAEDGTLWMWSISCHSTAACTQTLLGVFAGGHSESINDVCFTSDGKLLLSVSEDGTCCSWNPKSGEVVAKHSFASNSRFIEGALNCVLSLEANAKVTLVSGRNGLIRLVDVGSNRILASFDGHEESVECLLVNERLSIMVSASIDGRINFWDFDRANLRTSAMVAPHEQQEEESVGITRMKWLNREQTEFVTASTDGVLRIWDCRSGELVRELTGHQDVVLDLGVNANGKIVSCSDDCTCLVFE